MVRCFSNFLIIFLLLFTSSCMDQYNIWPFWDKIKKEREIAHRPTPKLTKEGKIPAKKTGVMLVEASGVDVKYNNFCSTCHGLSGKGDTPMGQALKPSPRNLTDKNWQKETSDEKIYKVIKEGGAAVGLSATMAPWGGVLSEDQLREMVKKVRSFSKE